MGKVVLYTNCGPDGNGFAIQNWNHGESLSKEACSVIGVPDGSKWGYGSGCIVEGNIDDEEDDEAISVNFYSYLVFSSLTLDKQAFLTYSCFSFCHRDRGLVT